MRGVSRSSCTRVGRTPWAVRSVVLPQRENDREMGSSVRAKVKMSRRATDLVTVGEEKKAGRELA